MVLEWYAKYWTGPGTGMVLEWCANGGPGTYTWNGLGMVLQVLEWSWNGLQVLDGMPGTGMVWNGTGMVWWYARYWNGPGMVLQVLDLEWYPRYWNGLGMTGKDADATREAYICKS